jgi:hypothetical protein
VLGGVEFEFVSGESLGRRLGKSGRVFENGSIEDPLTNAYESHHLMQWKRFLEEEENN